MTWVNCRIPNLRTTTTTTRSRGRRGRMSLEVRRSGPLSAVRVHKVFI
jgi:hypothetical protein